VGGLLQKHISVDLDLPGTIWSSHPLTHVAQRCAAAFNNYSLDDASINRLAEDGVIEVLLKLATSYSEQCRENCARALCNICAGFGMEHVVVNSTTAVPELMVMALVRSESIVTKQICAVALMNVLVDETMNKMIKYGIVWAMSSLTQSSQSASYALTNAKKGSARGSPRSSAAAAVEPTPEVHALLVTSCATAFMNISCSKAGRAHILADPGALQAVFHFLLGGASATGDASHHGVDHCQQLAWDIIWNLIEDNQNHHTLVQNELLRTVETLAVTARSDVDFDIGSGAHGSRAVHGSLDMDDHVLREIFNLIDSDHSNTLDKYELLDAIANNQQVLELVHSAPILEPLLQPDAFENALMELDTAHQSIVTYSEFKAFLISQTRRVTQARKSVNNMNKARANSEKESQKNVRVSSLHMQAAAAGSDEEDNYSEDNYSDDDQDVFEEEDQDDGSPTVSSLLAVMNEQARIANSAGGKKDAAKRTAQTLKNVAIVLRRLSSNPSICDEIVARNGISIIVAASRSLELDTKIMCGRVLCTLAEHPSTRKTVVAEGAMAALELISKSTDARVQVLIARTLRVLSLHGPNASIMAQQGFLAIVRKIYTVASETTSGPDANTMREAVLHAMAALETMSWESGAAEILVFTGGTEIIGLLLRYDLRTMCRPACVVLCNMTSVHRTHQNMVDEGFTDIFVEICDQVLFARSEAARTSAGAPGLLTDTRHRAMLALAYIAASLTSQRTRAAIVQAGAVPHVLEQAKDPGCTLVVKEICASILATLSHAAATRKVMIEQGSLEVITMLSECGSVSARMNCTTSMAKLSSSVDHLQQGTVASLISLCMAPQTSPKGSPISGSPRMVMVGGKSSGRSPMNATTSDNNDRGDKDGNGPSSAGGEGTHQEGGSAASGSPHQHRQRLHGDSISFDPASLPKPPERPDGDGEKNQWVRPFEKGSEEFPEPLPSIAPVRWDKQNIKVMGVAPPAPASSNNPDEGSSSSLESEAQQIEVIEKSMGGGAGKGDEELMAEGESERMAFAERWFPTYNDPGGSEQEKKARRKSLLTIEFHDTDDEEEEEARTFDGGSL
jgi:hypothetical protein